MDQLIEARHPSKRPRPLSAQEQEAILRDQVQFMQSQGLNMPRHGPGEDAGAPEAQGGAPGQGEADFDQIAAQEKVSLEDGDIEAGLARIAARSQRTAAQLRQFYEENHLMDGLRRQLMDEKVMQLITDAAELVPGFTSPGSGEGITC